MSHRLWGRFALVSGEGARPIQDGTCRCRLLEGAQVPHDFILFCFGDVAKS